ncbi:TnsA-like heteromeric transposase endonuclease subunit [Arthrobacter sp. PAMC25564]|uniref:TnsA-like heteromeric transposase endonuclease subunit n=1 Tax=Arthrobacter sp. PAMC25564 TaxID=2565366 RepID=UPI001F0F7961|nr:TnsA-like heteromeric transposase endonuclease subunit [Arthrobacter sp. PAMC25564]
MPDYFVRRADGSAVVIDVRPDFRVKPADQNVFDATAQLCSSVAWGYQRLGGLSAVYLANLRWLAGYRHPRCSHEPMATLLTDVLSNGPASIRGLAAAAAADPVIVLPTVFHLLWKQRICGDLKHRILHMDTRVELGAAP